MNRKSITAEDKFKRLQMQLLFLHSGIIILVTIFLLAVILEQSGTTIRKKVLSLTASNSRQLELNVNSYLQNVEQTVALLFADEEYYLYDETDASIEDYDKGKIEERITNRIVDLGMMENFSDFCIVYADDHRVGWCSNVTAGMFSDGGMYDTFAQYTGQNHTNDGWVWGIQDNVDRMYYVKRLNPHAILVASFYDQELENVFHYPEQLEGMTIRLVNQEERILFSSERNEIGKSLPQEIQKLLGDKANVSRMDAYYVATANRCDNGWLVICSIPTETVMRENNEMRVASIFTALGLVVLFIIVDLWSIQKVTRPMDGMVSHLEKKAYLDQLSGVWNKITFQDRVSVKIAEQMPGCVRVFAMMDMDHFKCVNDQLGHAYGDQVVSAMGSLLRRLYGETAMIGRMGGDEFAIYREYRDVQGIETVRGKIEEDAARTLHVFEKEFEQEHQQCGLSLSMGIRIISEETVTFMQIYADADAALYYSKQHGKNQYTIYQEGMLSEEQKTEPAQK